MKARKSKSGKVVLDRYLCNGCGYCVVACKRGCIATVVGQVDARGFLIPNVSMPEQCNACGSCAVMCPAFAIEVYEL
ncbi:4Fe-4S binding protein [Chloroflexota bacterium]